MKTSLRIDIDTREIEVQPPYYAADPDNPTAEEMADNEASFREWEAAGGRDQRRLRTILTAGPQDDWRTPLGLKRKAIESPRFHKDDAEARTRAERAMCDMIGRTIGKHLLEKPTEPTQP